MSIRTGIRIKDLVGFVDSPVERLSLLAKTLAVMVRRNLLCIATSSWGIKLFGCWWQSLLWLRWWKHKGETVRLWLIVTRWNQMVRSSLEVVWELQTEWGWLIQIDEDQGSLIIRSVSRCVSGLWLYNWYFILLPWVKSLMTRRLTINWGKCCSF